MPGRAKDGNDTSQTEDHGEIEPNQQAKAIGGRFAPTCQQNGAGNQTPEDVRAGTQNIHHSGSEQALAAGLATFSCFRVKVAPPSEGVKRQKENKKPASDIQDALKPIRHLA